MTIAQRVLLVDFVLANPLYANARLWVYEADVATGAATTTLATLYRAPTGTDEEANPFTLDSAGKMQRPVYVDGPVVARITDAQVPVHDTGVIGLMSRFREEWETALVYQVGDIIRDGAAGSDTGYLYICAVAHTADASFADDLAAEYWVLYLTGGTGGEGGSGVDVIGTTSGSFGTSSANYIKITGGTTGNPALVTAIGGDASPDIRFVLPSRGLVNIPRIAVGDSRVGASTPAPRLFSLYSDQTLSGSGGQAFRVGGILRGTLSQSLEGYFGHILDEDRLGFSDTSDGVSLIFQGATLRSGWSGGRTLAMDQLYVGNPASPGVGSSGTAGQGAYHVAGASFAYSYDSAGGRTGDARGNLFGRNDATRVRAGSGYHWNSAFGNETDVGVEDGNEVLWKGGIKVVQWSTDKNRGVIQDFAYGINNQPSGTAPGWMIGFQLGGFEGWWPFTSSSRIMAWRAANLTGGPSVAAASGIDLQGITFGKASFEANGLLVDGSGNLGALTASGVALQTRSAVTAATATVASVTVLEGGLFSGTVTLTGSAPTTSGTTATFSVATSSMPYVDNINAGGAGWAVGDTFVLAGGTYTTQAAGVVTRVSGGAVIGVKITQPGNYSARPSSPVTCTATSGSGTGLTLTPQVSILTVNVDNVGSNYSQWLPPTITSTGSSATYRPALFAVTMTPTAAPLLLGSNYADYATVTGAANTGVVDTSSPTIQAAGAATTMDVKVLGKGTGGRLNTTQLYVGSSAFRSSANDATVSYFRSGMTYATTAAPGFHVSGGFSGTVTSGQAFYHQIAINSDTVDPTTGSGPQGTHGLYVGHTVSAGAKGGRTALTGFLTISGAITASSSGAGAFCTGAGATAQASASAGGTAGFGNGRGNMFGGNWIAYLNSGATFWNSLVGGEMTVGAKTGSSVYYKNGFQIVLDATDTVAGTGGFDSGLLFTQQINGASPGWDEGITFGHSLGWWPIKSTGTLIGTVPSTGGLGPAYAAAFGVDFSAVTFSTAAFKSTGFTVNGSGVTTVARLITATETPASASASGTAGTITWDSSYIYVCTASNTWKRVAISTW